MILIVLCLNLSSDLIGSDEEDYDDEDDDGSRKAGISTRPKIRVKKEALSDSEVGFSSFGSSFLFDLDCYEFLNRKLEFYLVISFQSIKTIFFKKHSFC